MRLYFDKATDLLLAQERHSFDAAGKPIEQQEIFSDYRVYALVLPVGHMVRAVDVVDNLIAPALNQAAGMFETAITTRGLTSLQPTLDDMKAQLATAAQATSGLAARLEALTPAQWNASHEVLSSPRSSLDAARDALRKARQDGNTILAGLAHS